MGNLKISVRLGAAFSIIILIMLIVGGLAISRLNTLDKNITLLRACRT